MPRIDLESDEFEHYGAAVNFKHDPDAWEFVRLCFSIRHEFEFTAQYEVMALKNSRYLLRVTAGSVPKFPINLKEVGIEGSYFYNWTHQHLVLDLSACAAEMSADGLEWG